MSAVQSNPSLNSPFYRYFYITWVNILLGSKVNLHLLIIYIAEGTINIACISATRFSLLIRAVEGDKTASVTSDVTAISLLINEPFKCAFGVYRRLPFGDQRKQSSVLFQQKLYIQDTRGSFWEYLSLSVIAGTFALITVL